MDNKLLKSSISCWALVPAAGIGSRMNASRPKQYLSLNGQPLIEHSLRKLLQVSWIKGIIVAIAEHDEFWHELAISKDPNIETVLGGAERVDTVRNALDSIKNRLEEDDFILVHDAARPCLGSDDLHKLYAAMTTTDSGVVLADRLSDTVKRDNGYSAVMKTVPREGLWRALTPQVFPQRLLIRALEKAFNEDDAGITDESSAVERLGYSPLLLQGNSNNIKVTTESDLQLASLILTAQQNITYKEQDK